MSAISRLLQAKRAMPKGSTVRDAVNAGVLSEVDVKNVQAASNTVKVEAAKPAGFVKGLLLGTLLGLFK